MKILSHTIFILGLSALLCFKSNGQTPLGPPNSVEMKLTSVLADPLLKNASLGFYAIDATTGRVIAEHAPNQSLVPASTQKILTTATALEMLGGTHRVSTKLQYDGYIDSMCVLHGNIYIKGNGDPALMGKTFKKRYENLLEEWADAIVQLGIDSIDGAVVGDASSYSYEMVPSTWIWGDMGNYYGAGPSGLTWRDNKVVHHFASGPNKGDSTKVVCTLPYIPNYALYNTVKAADGKRDLAYFYGAPYALDREVRGTIPKDQMEFVVNASMPDPPLLAAFELESMLGQLGVHTGYRYTTSRIMKRKGVFPDADRITITKKSSPSLSSLVKQTNMYSVNLYAEHILCMVAAGKSGRGSTYSGTLKLKSYWKKKGMDVAGLYPNDGSGLSRFNAVTAKQLVFVLKHMKTKSRQFKSFYASLPVAGKSGTLRSVGRGTAAAGNLRAKSGTMSRVKSYAGYVKSKSGKDIVFAAILNNFNGSTTHAKKKLEELMVALANY